MAFHPTIEPDIEPGAHIHLSGTRYILFVDTDGKLKDDRERVNRSSVSS